jgi:hypothetical protein
MDRRRKANRENDEVTLQHKSRAEALRIDELVAEKLLQLQASIDQLGKTPEGALLLKRRIKFFGACERTADETTGQFYDKLRHWFNLEIPQTNAPRHPPRQVP